MRWTTRFRGGHREPAVEHEAAVDLRDALLEAKDDRIRELEARNAQLVAALAVARQTTQMQSFMYQRLRQRATAASDRTVEVPKRELHAPTEYIPRRSRW